MSTERRECSAQTTCPTPGAAARERYAWRFSFDVASPLMSPVNGNPKRKRGNNFHKRRASPVLRTSCWGSPACGSKPNLAARAAGGR
jgi:hypothetical protein